MYHLVSEANDKCFNLLGAYENGCHCLLSDYSPQAHQFDGVCPTRGHDLVVLGYMIVPCEASERGV